jgi:hypothetical protein
VAAVERAAVLRVRGEGRRRGGGEAGLGVTLHDHEPVEESLLNGSKPPRRISLLSFII